MNDSPQSRLTPLDETLDNVDGLPSIEALLGGETSADETPSTPLPGDSVGPYLLRRVLGRGGMGVVYEAARREGDIEMRVAIKLLRPELCTLELRPLLEREASLLSALSHANIARLLDWRMSSDETSYFAMEYVEGERIDRYCQRMQMNVAARLRLCLQLCEAISHAHRRMIAHLDLKPGNVLVDDQGQIRLLDFGVARALGRESVGEPTRGYSPHFASPEQRRGEPPTLQCDVYALGVMLRDLIAESPEPEPRELRAILSRAAADDATQRYASVDEFATDLRRFLACRPPLACATPATRRGVLFCRRNWRALGLTALVGAGLLAAGIAWAQQNRARQEQLRADRMRNSLRLLSDTVLFPLEEQMRDLPGATPTRLLAVQSGLRYLEELSRDASDDAELRVAVARAYLKLGDIQGDPSNANLGDYAGARRSYARARQLAANTRLAQARLLLGQINTHEGDVVYYNGDAATAQNMYRAAVDGLAVLRAENAADLALAQSYELALLDLGDVQMANGDNSPALTNYDKALALAEQLLAARPQETDAQRDVARLRSRHGDLAWAAGDWRGAQRAYRASFAVYEQLLRDHTDNARVRHSWIAGANNVALADEKLGDDESALGLYQRVLALERGNYAIDARNAQALRDLYVGCSNQSRVLLRMGRIADADASIAEEYALALRAQKANPQDALAIDDLTGALQHEAELAQKRRRWPEAIRHAQRALALLRGNMQRDAKPATASEIVGGLLQLGDYQLQVADRAGAARSLAEARSLLGRLDRNDAEQAAQTREVEAFAERLRARKDGVGR